AVATILLSKGPVNHLETTSSDGLVSNYSESYNRSAVGEKPALQLDDHLKNLLRELGHAINDTVSESDRITGAIAGVRAHGYDIVLKLDATIGLARRDAQSGQQDSRLTTLDRRFLESLRIQVDQDSFNEAEPERKAVAKLAMTPQDILFLKSLRLPPDDSESSFCPTPCSFAPHSRPRSPPASPHAQKPKSPPRSLKPLWIRPSPS